MGLRGVIRGRTIELEQEPPLPDGTQVEVELRTLLSDPLWGLRADQPNCFDAPLKSLEGGIICVGVKR